MASPLLNHWLLAACNIIGGDVDILQRIFVDKDHAAQGFYVVRLCVIPPKCHIESPWQLPSRLLTSHHLRP